MPTLQARDDVELVGMSLPLPNDPGIGFRSNFDIPWATPDYQDLLEAAPRCRRDLLTAWLPL